MKITTYTKKTRKGFTLIELMVVIAIIAALASVAYGPIMNQIRKADENQALQNGKQIFTAMQEFSTQNGSYPSDITAISLQEKLPDYDFGALTGDSSNCYFRQLFYANMNDEKNFYCKVKTENGLTTKIPDNEMYSGKGLERGENGYAYVMLGEGRAVTTGNTSVPLIITSVEANAPGDKVIFDGESFNKKALVVRIDSSATWEILTENDDVYTLPNLFLKDKKGRSTGEKFVVLAPEL